MAESSSLYVPGQGKNDGWVLWPEVGTYSIEPEDRTIVKESYGGTEQRRIGLYPIGGRSHFTFRTMKLTATQSRQMRDFLRTVRGAALPFNFFDFLRQSYALEPCGTADGTGSLVIPFRDLRNVTAVYDDGSPVTAGWTLTADVGNGRETRINFVVPYPANNSAMTFDGEGCKRYVCRREGDRQVGRPFAGGETWNDAIAPADLQWDLAFLEVI